MIAMLAAVAVASASRFEAEDAVLAAGAEVVVDSSAGGGRYVRLGKGSVRWTVEVPQAGRYEIRLRYRTGGSDRAQFLRIGSVERGIGFPMTAGEWEEVRTIRHFGAGKNEVELRADWGELDVDALRFSVLPRGEITPVVGVPTVTPRQTAWRPGQVGPRLYVDPAGAMLEGVRIGESRVRFAAQPYPFVDGALWVTLDPNDLAAIPGGERTATLRFSGGRERTILLRIVSKPLRAPWTIVTLDVSHGAATFMRLPSGETALIDCATSESAERVVLPFLRRHKVARIDHLVLTHYHDDHVGGLPLLNATVKIGRMHDYKDFRVGQRFQLGGLHATVLNAFESGEDENPRSLALRLEYRGFVFQHGADTYGINQVAMLRRFSPERLRAHVFHANHHLHGSVDVGFFRTVDPMLVLVSAEEAVYARGAYATHYRESIEMPLKAGGRLIETLLTREVGSIVIRIHDGRKWAYETHADAVLPTGSL